jgi:hypothetical protein
MRHRCPPLHIAKLSRNAKLVRFRSMADFEQASPRSIWLKLPNSRAQRLAAMGFFAHGAQIMASNPATMLFLSRDAGVMVLTKLVQMTGSAGDDAADGLSYADIGARFGVSRTHVRELLQDAERAQLVALSGRGGRLVELKPAVWQAFDRFVAESMSGHDMLFKIAARRPQSNRLFKMPACRIHQPQGFDWRSRRLKYLAENSAVKTYLIPERTKLLSNHRRHAVLASGAAKR